VSTDTTVKWTPVSGAYSYEVWRRRTDAAQWERTGIMIFENCHARICAPGRPVVAKLEHIRVDDWVFGVTAMGKNQFESPVASAVPGGAFKPYVAPAKEAKKP
jgi:hypothetical protein